MIGDCILSLCVSNWLNKVFPEATQTLYLDKKCSQLGVLFFNHSVIKEIKISEKSDEFSNNDQEYFKQYDLVFDPFSPVLDQGYYNKMHISKQLFLMNRTWPECKYLRDAEREYDSLSFEEKCPKLIPWFDILEYKRFVAIWPEAGYANKDKSINLRSPKEEFWIELVKDLNKMGYKVLQFGTLKSGFLGDREKKLDIENCISLNLLDAVKKSLSCELCITTDSGISHVLNAYGARCICLYTNYLWGHITNFEAMTPLNYKNNLKLIFGKDGINNISKEEILEFVKNNL